MPRMRHARCSWGNEICICIANRVQLHFAYIMLLLLTKWEHFEPSSLQSEIKEEKEHDAEKVEARRWRDTQDTLCNHISETIKDSLNHCSTLQSIKLAVLSVCSLMFWNYTFSFPLSKIGSALIVGVFTNLLGCLPYNIKCLRMTVVVNLYYMNKTELRWMNGDNTPSCLLAARAVASHWPFKQNAWLRCYFYR